MVTPGSALDWMQASIMAVALAGLAAACGRALWEEEGHAPPASGLVDPTAVAEDVEAVR